MQTDNIIEKAKRLGLDTGSSSSTADNLRLIAEQVGINDFNSISDVDRLEKVLDEIINEQENIDDSNISNLQEQEVPEQQNSGRFGEKEYNQARDENGRYNKEYYKAKQKESDQKLDDAKKEKRLNDKKVGLDENGHNKYKKKNALDKVNDRANVAKARQDAISNKLANAKANAYRAMHPGEALKDAAKDKAKTAVKNVGKKAGKAAVKGLKAAGNALVKFLASNPYALAIVGIVAVILFLIILISGGSSSGGNGGFSYGINGYEYIEPKCSEIRIIDGDYPGTYQIEEYIAGVVEAEFGTAHREKDKDGAVNHLEAAKAGAVAARSYVQKNVSSDCEIESSSRKQNYKKPSATSIQIAEETRGLVLTRNGEIISAQYDAFCTDSPQDDIDNYIVCQKNQKIPRTWVENHAGIKEEWKSGTRAGAHGNGMSAWGAIYLSDQGSTFEEILKYYYDDVELRSIYPSFDVNSNYTYEISSAATSSIPTQIANTPLNELLSENEYNALNNLIYSSVVEAGVGSRDAVVASAVTPIKYLAENHGVLIPYFLSGGHGHGTNYNKANVYDTLTTSYYGIDPLWGTPGEFWYQGGSYGYIEYSAYGPDCSSFVPWVFHNAGLNMSVGLAGRFKEYGDKEALCGSYIAKPGDLLESNGHITVIVGVDEVNKKYYIAHASGGAYGVKINAFDFCGSDSYYIVNMDKYFSNPANINSNYENAYESGVRSYR